MKRTTKVLAVITGTSLLLLAGVFLSNATTKMNYLYYPADNLSKATLLPSYFLNGERFYIKMATVKGDTLMGFGDTGGGRCMMLPMVIDRLGLQGSVRKAALKGILKLNYVRFNEVVTDPRIPGPEQLQSFVLRRHLKKVRQPFLVIPPMSNDLKSMMEAQPFDVFLGQNFFMGKAWTLDYLHRQIWVNTPIAASEEGRAGVQKLGFKKNAQNEKLYGHPSMVIEVNGEKIDVLFPEFRTFFTKGELMAFRA